MSISASATTNLHSYFWMIPQLRDTIGKGRRIVRWANIARLSVEHVGCGAAPVGYDRGESGGHRFEDGLPKGFFRAGENKYITGGKSVRQIVTI